MIYPKIKSLLDKLDCDRRVENAESLYLSLEELNISPKSELGEFLINYDPINLASKKTGIYILDVMNPTAGYSRITTKGGLGSPIGMTYQFVQETWELPKDFLPLTSTEGEGAILINLETNRVYDFCVEQINQLWFFAD
jgi:hypothetical protein